MAHSRSWRRQNARLWPDPDTGAPWKSSVASNGFDVLLVSQFTLHGYFSGNKPDFHLSSACDWLAANPAQMPADDDD